MLILWSVVSFASRFTSGVLSLMRGKPWRISIYEGAQASYTDKFWAQGSEKMTERERHFCQVGATLQGYPISEAEQAAKCEAVIRHLKLNKKDVVCDLCCGNGMITAELAKVAKCAIGVDFSAALLSVAKEHYMSHNISYEFLDLTLRDASVLAKYEPITKICFHSCLQYYSPDDFSSLVSFLRSLSRGLEVQIFIGGIPERAQKFAFYKTYRQRLSYFARLVNREVDIIGTWWTRKQIARLTEEAGGTCVCVDQETPSTLHYRFDAILTFPPY